MLYELRIYECVPGRLPDLLKRFDTITLKLWEKHGIKQAGFWTTVIGESNQTLYYFVTWDSLAEREKKWNAFGADPEWIKARAQTEANGAIVANVKNFRLAPTGRSAQRFQQSPGRLQVSRLKSLGEPTIDRRQQVACLVAPSLVAQQPGQINRAP